MAPESTTAIAAGLSSATTGADTPTAMTISRPAKEPLQALFTAMVAVMVQGAALTGILTFCNWPVATAPARILYLGLSLIAAQICLALIVIAFVSSRIGRVDASVGQNHIELSGREN